MNIFHTLVVKIKHYLFFENLEKTRRNLKVVFI